MAAEFFVVSDAAVKVPSVDEERDYFNRFYRPEDPPEDYKIGFDFELPDGIRVDQNARFVVAYVLDPTSDSDMPYSVRLNGTQIKDGRSRSGVRRGAWEVARDLLRDSPATNTIEFWALPTPDSRGFLRVSDIVIWYKSR
jgi:hypothetical protein